MSNYLPSGARLPGNSRRRELTARRDARKPPSHGAWTSDWAAPTIMGPSGSVVLHIFTPPAIPAAVGLVPAERQLVSYLQSAPKLLSTVLAGPGGGKAHHAQIIARPDQPGPSAMGVWARQVASQSCLRRDEPGGGHLATKGMCGTTIPPGPLWQLMPRTC